MKPRSTEVHDTHPFKHARHPRALRESAKGWWRLVWCQERCHKSENEARCHALQRSLKGLGGSLVCLKKANQFSEWLLKSPRPMFVLLTDWREAQPCMQFLAEQGSVARPACTVVLCDSQRQFGRASQWAQRQPPCVGAILVREQGRIPPQVLNGLVHRHFAHSPEEAPPRSQRPRAATSPTRSSASSSTSTPTSPGSPVKLACLPDGRLSIVSIEPL